MLGSSNPQHDYSSDVILGRIPGVTRTVLSSTRTIATAFNSVVNGVDVWPGAANELTFATANESWEILSSSALDAAGNTGAEAISITALDFAKNSLAVFTVNLNGTTPVTLPGGATYGWLNGASTVGVNTAAQRRKQQGDITIRVAGGGAIRGIMPALTGGLGQAIYTAPLNATTLIRALECQIVSSGGGTARGADFILSFRNPNGNINQPRRIGTTDTQPYALDAHTNIRVPAGFTFIAQCVYTSNNAMTVAVNYEAHTYV